eukprot:2779866-Rhodomonas_salina.14
MLAQPAHSLRVGPRTRLCARAICWLRPAQFNATGVRCSHHERDRTRHVRESRREYRARRALAS